MNHRETHHRETGKDEFTKDFRYIALHFTRTRMRWFHKSKCRKMTILNIAKHTEFIMMTGYT
jgi:hypothetical protein